MDVLNLVNSPYMDYQLGLAIRHMPECKAIFLYNAL